MCEKRKHLKKSESKSTLDKYIGKYEDEKASEIKLSKESTLLNLKVVAD